MRSQRVNLAGPLAGSPSYAYAMILMRLTSSCWVDARVLDINGRWIASADTPDGPSLGLASLRWVAAEVALQPFDGIAEEPLAGVPHARGLG